tara:strand:+ start:24004 stop:24354 length:351 start_codon:yes stop_codon:yes gene_type:complete
MSIIEKIMSWFGGRAVPSANVVEEVIAGTQLSSTWEAEELLPKEAREETKAKEKPKAKPKKKASAKKAGYTKASLDKMTKAQLIELGKKEFKIELNKKETKMTLVKILLGTIKKAR